MIIGAIIVGLITLVLGILTQWAIKHRSGNMSYGVFMGIIITLFCVLEVCIVSDIITKPEPKAMDVYQGKTTIEYKVVDNVKVDSVVIFKNDEYRK